MICKLKKFLHKTGVIFLLCCFAFYRRLRHRNHSSREIWLIGEFRGHCLNDNGYFFFRYCRECFPDKEVYFLIDRDSPNYQNWLKTDENVVHFGSVRHVYLFCNARIGFYTHSFPDLMYRRIFDIFGRRLKLVFLHHGVLGFKKFNDYYLKDKNRMDVFIVGSEGERRILIEKIGVKSDIVKATGYARYDFLKNDLSRHHYQIAYIPTYRDWISDNFNSSHFATRVYGFLNNTRLHDLLEMKNVFLQFYIHYRVQFQIDVTSIKSTRVLFTKAGDQSLSEIISQSRMLITDYSSVAWDFRFLQKPVAFYRFDKDRYESKRGSYLPLNEDIIGRSFYDEDSLIDEIDYTIRSNFECRLSSRSVDEFFPVMDGNSCKRICEAIGQLV